MTKLTTIVFATQKLAVAYVAGLLVRSLISR
jgi:hypothetical protein